MTNPLFQLFLNPFSGSAGLNMVAILLYITLLALIGLAILERGEK